MSLQEKLHLIRYRVANVTNGMEWNRIAGGKKGKRGCIGGTGRNDGVWGGMKRTWRASSRSLFSGQLRALPVPSKVSAETIDFAVESNQWMALVILSAGCFGTGMVI